MSVFKKIPVLLLLQVPGVGGKGDGRYGNMGGGGYIYCTYVAICVQTHSRIESLTTNS
jgi:hypothetical protein